MKLEIGKKYVRRDGEAVACVSLTDPWSPDCPYQAMCIGTDYDIAFYRLDGRASLAEYQSMYDIVDEYHEEEVLTMNIFRTRNGQLLGFHNAGMGDGHCLGSVRFLVRGDRVLSAEVKQCTPAS